MAPDPLTEREQLLLLSLWGRVLVACFPPLTAVRTWLSLKTDVPLHHGPDHRNSPRSIHRQADYETFFSGACMQIAPGQGDLEVTPQQTLAVRIVAFSLSCAHLDILNGLLLGGSLPYNFSHRLWKKSVQDYLDGKPLIEVTGLQAFTDVINILPPGRHRILLIDKQGNPLTDRAVTCLRSHCCEGVKFPVDLYIVHEAAMGRELPKQVRIDLI